MENIHIFSGNYSCILAAYFNKIVIDNLNNEGANREFTNKQGYENDNSATRSIAVFDADFNDNETYAFQDKLTNSMSFHDKPSNEIISQIKIKDNFNKFETSYLKNSYDSLLWNNKLDLIELTTRKDQDTKSWNCLSYLKKTLNKKNIFSLKITNKLIKKKNGLLQFDNCDFFGFSDSVFHYNIEEILESIRHELELSDVTRTIYMSSDLDNIYSNISKIITEFLNDEAPHSYKPSIMLFSKNDIYEFNCCKNFELENLQKFSISRFLVDQSKFCEDFWLLNMNYIKSLLDVEYTITSNPFVLSALVLEQISKIIKNFGNLNFNSLVFIENSLSHPFRNIAISRLPFKNQSDTYLHLQKKNSKESILKKHYLDICQSNYFGLDDVDKSYIFSMNYIADNEQNSHFNKETLNYIISNTNSLVRNLEMKVADEKIKLSTIIHPIIDLNKCHTVNYILEESLNCKFNSKLLELINRYFKIEQEEINEIIEQILIWKE